MESKKRFKFLPNRILAGFAFSLTLGFSSPATAALYDRGGGLLYDDVLNVTWLQDANYAKTSGYSTTGLMDWTSAQNWASSLVYHDSANNVDYSGWRLASIPNNEIPFHFGWWAAVGDNNAPLGAQSELSYMYYNNLGLNGYDNTYGAWQSNFGIFGNGTTGGQNNIGLVQNLQSSYYWAGYTNTSPFYNQAWLFNTNNGNHDINVNYNSGFAWAVHDGDIALTAVPVPAAVWLFAGGLGMLTLNRQRKKYI